MIMIIRDVEIIGNRTNARLSFIERMCCRLIRVACRQGTLPITWDTSLSVSSAHCKTVYMFPNVSYKSICFLFELIYKYSVS